MHTPVPSLKRHEIKSESEVMDGHKLFEEDRMGIAGNEREKTMGRDTI
jgi:hypothetical protein